MRVLEVEEHNKPIVGFKLISDISYFKKDDAIDFVMPKKNESGIFKKFYSQTFIADKKIFFCFRKEIISSYKLIFVTWFVIYKSAMEEKKKGFGNTNVRNILYKIILLLFTAIYFVDKESHDRSYNFIELVILVCFIVVLIIEAVKIEEFLKRKPKEE